MRVKDIREDIFDEQLVKRIYWLYKGDDFIAYINLKYTHDLIDEVVFSMSELFQPINLSLESSQIGSKWKLFIPHYITQSFATKEHTFTISIKLMTGVIITLFKGFINVNNRLFTNGEKPNITMTIIAERNPTEEDYVYQIGTPWFNKESKELFYLTKVQQESATWIDHTSTVLVEYINTELAKKADKDYVDNELSLVYKAVYDYTKEMKDVLGWVEEFLGELIVSSAIYVGDYDYAIIRAISSDSQTHVKFVRVKDFVSNTPITICDNVTIQYEHSMKEFVINGYAGCNAINVYGVYNSIEDTLGDIQSILEEI